MNIKFLMKVIESYELCQLPYVDDEQEAAADKEMCRKTLNELQEIYELADCTRDEYDGRCCILHESALINLMLYAFQGVCSKDATYEEFEVDCFSENITNCLTQSVLKVAYEAISEA